MKRFLLFWIISRITIFCYAQKMVVNTIVELTTDLYASTHSMPDGNGGSCAVLKVNIPSIKDVKFSGDIVGDVSYIPGEYHVYVPAGVKQIKFIHPTYGEGFIDFADFGIQVQSKTTYRIIVTKTNGEKTNYGSLDITSNEDFADIIMDGYYVGQTPLLLPKVLMGEHNLIIGKDDFKTKATSVNVNKLETESNIDLPKKNTLVEHKDETTGLYGLKYYETGEVCVPAKYEDASSIQDMNGRAYLCLKENNMWFLYDNDGQFVGQIDDWIDSNEPELAGMTPIRKGNKWGFLHHLGGHLNVHCDYDELFPFDGGVYTYAKKNGKWGIIDISGKVIIPFEYDYDAHGLYDWPGNGLFYLQKLEKWGCLNSKGEIIVAFTHDTIEDAYKAAEMTIPEPKKLDVNSFEYISGLTVSEELPNGQKIVSDEKDKFSIMGADGDLLFPLVFDTILSYDDNYYLAQLHGFIGIFDNKGTSVSPMKYYFWNQDEYGNPYALQDENGAFIKISDIIKYAAK